LVGELYRINHDSNSVYTGSEEVAPGKKAVLRFNLPDGVMSVAVDGGEIGERFIRTADGVVDTQPLSPGGTQILLRYLLPFSGAEAELAQSIAYPVERLNVLVVDGPEVTTDLQNVGVQTAAEQQWNSFEGANLPAGQAISLRLAGLNEAQGAEVAAPANASAVVAQTPGLLIGIGVAALAAVLLVFGGYLLLKPKDAAEPEAAPVAAPAAPLDVAAERQRLAASIAQLDDLYAAGGIEQERYLSARSVLKRSLVAVAVGARSETGPSGEAAETGPSGEAAETGPSDQAAETGPSDQAAETGPSDEAVETGPSGEAAETGPSGEAAETGPSDEAAETGPSDEEGAGQ
jgi:hypothetical protein